MHSLVHPDRIELAATLCFLMAVAHTFLASRLHVLANRFPSGSAWRQLLHLLGEVEVAFGLWAVLFVLLLAILRGPVEAASYLARCRFEEPVFVFVILAACATRPILDLVSTSLELGARLLWLPRAVSLYLVLLIAGPLLGSFVTEPAAMTVVAVLLGRDFLAFSRNRRFCYASLALLFVNVSIGGTLTPYAAPPVLMVARQWDWHLRFMLTYFGSSAVAAIVVSTVLTAVVFQRELAAIARLRDAAPPARGPRLPIWVSLLHLIFVGLLLVAHARTELLIALFVLFLGLYTITRRFQSKLRLRESLLVGIFLTGIVVLGEPQQWWLDPVLRALTPPQIYLGSMGLTAIVDNAALTYLGSQVGSLTAAAKYLLLAGSVVGGGLTVIANAPNPVGLSLLETYFEEEGFSAGWLLLWALPPTLVAAASFWWILPVR